MSLNLNEKKSEILSKAFGFMATAKSLTDIYESNFKFVSKYVHATSRGHEAIQIALGMQLQSQDFLSAYYRDDSLLLAIGMRPYELMLQLMAKRADPFSGGRTYYAHPSLKDPDKPKIPHQSSATGMQAIPTTGIALGMQYREIIGMQDKIGDMPLVVCSLGDACITEGEVSEAFHMAALKQLPILYLVQDNDWDISAHSREIRMGNAFDYAKGFPGLEAISIDGTDFELCYNTIESVFQVIRNERRPFLIHARVPLLNHHTSGVRKEWYRDDLDIQSLRDPYPKFKDYLVNNGFLTSDLEEIESTSYQIALDDFNLAKSAEDPHPSDLYLHDFAPTTIVKEQGNRTPADGSEKVMVDCALFAIDELMRKHQECLLYGQDVGRRLGGVFREAATLAEKFGDHRVFNTPIQEAFIVGSTVGMSAIGLKPIVEVQFADYIWPGLNQLFTEVARSCFLTNGKYPVSMILRVPIGAYGSGGPYHSSSVESVVCNIKGIKVVYPSNGADLKGLIKGAYYDPNPVIIFEHKGLYWSKVPGTEAARCIMPDEDYILPLGKANLVIEAEMALQSKESAVCIITYGMGVHWSINAAKNFPGKVTIVDLRTLVPLDEEMIYQQVKLHHRCLVVTEETLENSFAQSLAGRIADNCFEFLDAPVKMIGAKNLPAIPLNSILEMEMLPNAEIVAKSLEYLLNY
ncbi:MAG: tungsten formylmethanofuran dehydrogenase [Saprospiraceae bacterium]|nr:tungsten formylmethanofuran dehydrogenase [Candidatus Vicinibacter affinis]MBP6172632.1 tungsten formylmethanofuran dehydrogenase [Saprospiraceae bacterium]MBK6571068.1 tungsten formylmethanofuran dehydrogenase [Candidatus Vicinibacter affinis]MBK6822708.1 tungsten formylmethanofuran dehydrogenase [Candidatus Vicinibacter affinis]MBK7304804.1 tungsten formylmethanofuran dehydrogenase [Candidatus Vicinibacter affinis]